MMRGTPYVMRRRLLLAPSGLPCTPPPFGTLVAIDLKTGARWEVPLGSFVAPFGPDVAAKIRADWGSPNLGGPIVTAGGLVFIGAALDRPAARATMSRPAASSGTARCRERQGDADELPPRLGEQFVAVAVGGGDAWGAGDHVVAFRLVR